MGPIVVTWVSIIGGRWRWWDPRGRLVVCWVWRDVTEWLRRRRFEKTRTSWVYCPSCREDLNGLNAEDHFVSDDARGVTYVCRACGTESLWQFDTPCPLLIRTSTYD